MTGQVRILRLGDDQPSADQLAEIVAALNAYPYSLRVTGGVGAEALVERLRGADAPKIAISRIEVDQKKLAEAAKSGATRQSRTAETMEAHTDSTFLPRPHEVIAFDFVRPSETGGETIITPVDDILASLDGEARAGLGATDFPFAEHQKPILEGEPDAPRIRFNWLQIEKSAGDAGVTEKQATLISALRGAIAGASGDLRFRAEAGETVLINNRRALHSRTAFPPNSNRLMVRYRCNSDLVR